MPLPTGYPSNLFAANFLWNCTTSPFLKHAALTSNPVCCTPMLWSPDANSRLTGKVPDAGKDWRQEEKGMAEDEMAGWHHRLNRNAFEATAEKLKAREAWHAAVRGVAESRTGLSHWATTTASWPRYSQTRISLAKRFYPALKKPIQS